MPLYELGVILDPEATPDQESAGLERLEKIISDAGGEIVQKDGWGRRRLAYPINKRTHGVYHFWQFEAPGTVQEALAFELKTNDLFMRNLVLNLDRELQRKRKIERQVQAKAAKKAAAREAAAENQTEG